MNNNMKDTSSKKQGKASTTGNNVSNYKYSPKVETPNPKASNKTTNKETN